MDWTSFALGAVAGWFGTLVIMLVAITLSAVRADEP
jgi:hypothetical protein